MRIDVVTIFPEWFASLDVSLTGKARASGLVDIAVHDLRDWTHDRHRTVDDTPYGGGAGMVMKPEPWGEALDEVRGDGRPTLVVPTPSGVPFTQAIARELAGLDHLVVACGRYEGIDQRVVEEAASTYAVRELSLGDFVLNGGEVAAAAVIEAVVRLLPGFMGNPDSLAEESHEDGLLEYPVYTKPATWRDREVPDGAALRRPRRDRGLASRRVGTPYGRPPPRPRAPRGAGRARWARPRGPARHTGGCRRAVHADPGLLAPGALGEPGRRHPGARGVLRGRPAGPRGLDHVRRPGRRTDRRLDPRARSSATARCGTSGV